jgi:hypothetical protein
MARYQLEQIAYVPKVGGIYVTGAMKHLVQAEGKIVIDFASFPPGDFKSLINIVRHGFTTSKENSSMAVLRMLAETSAPKIHEIGYVGKREMRVLVARQNAEQYRTDLIAAGHMLDVDLSEAATVGMDYDGGLKWLHVDCYRGGITGVGTRRRGGHQLRPATSKMISLVKQWTLETYHMRAPLVDFLNKKPRLEWSLSSPAAK